MIVQLLSYMPDSDPTTPGVIVDCAGLAPGLAGMYSAPEPLAATLPALASECRGAFVAEKLDDTRRMFAATQTAIYEATGATWTDRSRGGGYVGSAASKWNWAQYGDVTLATNKIDAMQAATTGAFADVSASAPKASVVATVDEWVFAFATNEGTFGDQTNRWWTAAQGSYTDWVPSITTGSVTGQLVGTPGPIVAGRRLGSQMVAYKQRGIYVATFQGAPSWWGWQQVPGYAGALGPDAIVDIEIDGVPAHVFVGLDDFYLFDGARPVAIGTGYVRQRFFERLNSAYRGAVQARADRANSLVYIWYPGPSSSGKCDEVLLYNWKSRKWGVGRRQTIEWALDYSQPSLTYDELGTYYATYDAFPNAPYDSAFLSAGSYTPGIFNASHQLLLFNGAPNECNLTLGDMGTEDAMSTISRVRPRFKPGSGFPSAGTLIHYHRDTLADSITTGATVAIDAGRFDLLQEDRWHRLEMTFVGACELMALAVDMEATAGE